MPSPSNAPAIVSVPAATEVAHPGPGAVTHRVANAVVPGGDAVPAPSPVMSLDHVPDPFYRRHPHAMWAIDPVTLEILDANDAMLRWIGVPLPMLRDLGLDALCVPGAPAPASVRGLGGDFVPVPSVAGLRLPTGNAVPASLFAAAVRLAGRKAVLLMATFESHGRDESGAHRLRLVADALPWPVVCFGETLRCDYANRSMGLLAGRDATDCIGLHLDEFPLSGPGAWSWGAAGRAALAEGVTQVCECVTRDDQDRPRYLEATMTRVEGQTPATKPFVLVSVRDVTQHRTLRAAIDRSEARTRQTLAFGRVGLWERDLETGRILWSPEVSAIFGFTREARVLTYEELVPLVHAEDRRQWERARAAWLSGVGLEVEHRIVHPDGTERWILQRGCIEAADAGVPRRLLGVVLDTSERKQAEIALRESEQRLRLITELSSDFFWELDAGLRFTQHTRSSGRSDPSPAPVIGQHPWQLNHLHAEESVRRRHRAALERRKPFRNLHVTRRRLDGTVCHHLISAIPKHGPHGEFTGFVGVSQDITELENSKGMQRELERRFEQLANCIEEIFWFGEANPERVLYVSPAFRTVYGFAEQALYDDPRLWIRQAHPDDRPAVLETFGNWVESNGPENCSCEYRIIRADGDVRWIRDRRVRIGREKSGAMRLSGTTEDITQRKLAELQLEETSERFRLIMENTREVVWISDPEVSRTDYCSPAVESVWGIPHRVALADAGAWRALVEPADMPRIEEAMAQQLRGFRAAMDFRIRRPDGEIRWLTVRTCPMVDRTGRRLVCGVTEDITDRILRQHRELEAANRQRDVLVREVHHRIKNNLQGVVGLLRKHLRRRPEASPILEGAIAQVQSIAVVYGLQGAGAPAGVFFGDVVRAIARVLEGLTHHPIALEGLEDDHVKARLLEGEAAAVALVVNELMMNAVKHASDPGVPARVRLDPAPGRGVTLRIRNPGRLPAGFRFSDRACGGTGLELVRALMPRDGMIADIASHGGWVETTVCVSYPCVVVEQPFTDAGGECGTTPAPSSSGCEPKSGDHMP